MENVMDLPGWGQFQFVGHESNLLDHTERAEAAIVEFLAGPGGLDIGGVEENKVAIGEGRRGISAPVVGAFHGLGSKVKGRGCLFVEGTHLFSKVVSARYI